MGKSYQSPRCASSPPPSPPTRPVDYAGAPMAGSDESAAAEPSGRRAVTSVARAIALLEALGETSEGLGVNELARRIEVNPSTASRLLATLERGGLVVRRPGGGYQLGLRFVTLADRVLARLDVRDLARPHLHALVAQTGETSTLSLPVGGEAVTVDFVPGTSSVVSMARVGRPNTLHATAIGKTMLAFGAAAALPRADRLAPLTARTIVDRDALAAAVEQVRERGWGESVGEREDDLAALAAPVHGPDGRLAAILGLQGPLARMTGRRRSEILPLLLGAAAQLSRDLGAQAAT
jgi:DNA-binding IclR family transcriptional regulator